MRGLKRSGKARSIIVKDEVGTEVSLQTSCDRSYCEIKSSWPDGGGGLWKLSCRG